MYVAHRTDPGASVEINLEDRETTVKGSYFQIGSAVLNGEVGQNTIVARELSTHVSLSIQWDHHMRLCVSFSRIPQVRNGISIHGPNITDGTGLLVRNYRAKLCRVVRLEDRTGLHFPTTLRRLTTQRGLVSQQEHYVRVRARCQAVH